MQGYKCIISFHLTHEMNYGTCSVIALLPTLPWAKSAESTLSCQIKTPDLLLYLVNFLSFYPHFVFRPLYSSYFTLTYYRKFKWESKLPASRILLGCFYSVGKSNLKIGSFSLLTSIQQSNERVKDLWSEWFIIHESDKNSILYWQSNPRKVGFSFNQSKSFDLVNVRKTTVFFSNLDR